MYPNEIILGMGFYEIFILVGIVCCFITFRVLGDRNKFSAKYQNSVLGYAFAAIVLGYLAAVLVQAVYNALETGVFEIAKDTGATFLGGLIGGAGTFLACYFVVGHFIFKKKENGRKEHLEAFWSLSSIAAACIAVAHAFGRIGCFFAGCCYGKETDSFLGVRFVGEHVDRLPVQLFESAFLFVLFAVLICLHVKKENFLFGLPLYMVSYGIWRFFAEFMRGDDRGEFFVKFLSPSQGTSILLVLGGIVLYFVIKKVARKAVGGTLITENEEETD